MQYYLKCKFCNCKIIKDAESCNIQNHASFKKINNYNNQKCSKYRIVQSVKMCISQDQHQSAGISSSHRQSVRVQLAHAPAFGDYWEKRMKIEWGSVKVQNCKTAQSAKVGIGTSRLLHAPFYGRKPFGPNMYDWKPK